MRISSLSSASSAPCFDCRQKFAFSSSYLPPTSKRRSDFWAAKKGVHKIQAEPTCRRRSPATNKPRADPHDAYSHQVGAQAVVRPMVWLGGLVAAADR